MTNDVSDGGQRPRNGPARAVLLAAVLAGTALPAAACSGGSPPAGSSTQVTVQKLDAYAQCMRSHGEPDFYFSARGSAATAGAQELSIAGYRVPGVDPFTSQFASASKACAHLFPIHPPTAADLQKLLRQEVKAAACMRAHGYPDYPDPIAGNRGLINEPLPASIDTRSPQFQAAQKACGA